MHARDPAGSQERERSAAPAPGGEPAPGDEPAPWDVVVVGAGPAGATAARVAARAGARVLLLDKAALPRYKTCGGGIIGMTRRALPADFALVPAEEIRAVTLTLGGRFARTRRSPHILFYTVDRAEFDTALVEGARAQGVQLRERTSVRGVTPEDDSGTVGLQLVSGATLRARAVVGADGSAGRIAGHVGVTCEQVDLGLEAEIPVPEAVAARWSGRALLDWGPLPGSYGWVFPKGATLTVGVIAAREQGSALRQYFAQFVEQLGLGAYPPSVTSGHLTRCRRADSPLARGRVLVCGDAAGLLEPLTREGISFALRSAAVAGQCAAGIAGAGGPASGGPASGQPEGHPGHQPGELAAAYARTVTATLGSEMHTGAKLHAVFARHPRALHAALVGFPPAWRAFVRFTSGAANFEEIFASVRAARRRAASLRARRACR